MSSKYPNDPMWTSIMEEISKRKSSLELSEEPIKIDMLTPKQIVQELDQTVIGQTKAKQLLAVAAFNRLLAITNSNANRDKDEYFFEKNNILLVGNTGCGKTHLVRALSQSVSLPVTIQDATSFTSSGYVGRNVEDCIEDLILNAKALVKKTYDTNLLSGGQKRELVKKYIEYGIIYIDEADKIRTTKGHGKDVNGRSVQESFLKLVEGTEVRSHGTVVDTSNILFIFGGAFSGLDKIILNRTNKKTIGFHSDNSEDKIDRANLMNTAISKDFTDFGMIPELMGRLSTVAALTDLDRDMIARIFAEPKRSIMSQVINEFKSYDVQVSFTDEAIGVIADKAAALKLGARGLKSICQGILRPLYYHLPSFTGVKKVLITKQLLETLQDKDEGL